MLQPPFRVTIRAAIAPLLSDARASASQVSQLLRGHHADAMERSGDWVRLRGADGYDGWCHVGYVHDMRADAEPVHSMWANEHRMSLGCTVRRSDGSVIALPLGAFLDADEASVSGLAMNARGRGRYFAADGALLVERTRSLFVGTPYQWGGVTPWGADCSGVVQTIFALHGTQLPRDAWQQGETGMAVGNDVSELRPADLLFFSDRDDGRITHVAISMGGSQVVHSSLSNGGYGINDLHGGDPVAQMLQRTFRFTRRVL